MDIEENTVGYSEAEYQELNDDQKRAIHLMDAVCGTDPEVKKYWESKSGQPYGEPERTPDLIYSLGFDAEELLVTYAALRTYLRGLVSQENEDFNQIQRVVRLLAALRPRAVKASGAQIQFG